MVAILYLKVNLLRKNSKKYHARQNRRKPRKTAKNKHRLTGAKNAVKPLINRVIQQSLAAARTRPRQTKPPEQTGRNNAHTKQRDVPETTRAQHGTGTTSPNNSRNNKTRTQKAPPQPPQKRSGRRSHARQLGGVNDHDARRISSTRPRSSSVKEMSPSGQRPAARFCARRPSRYAPRDSPRP